MQHFEDGTFYAPDDKALRFIATVGTLRLWRCKGRGPAFFKIRNRVMYRGEDLNAWLADQRVVPGEAA